LAFETQEGTLLHELVHLVSNWRFDAFLTSCGLSRAEIPKGLSRHMIGDVKLESIATDWKLLAEQTWWDDTAYGITLCEHLARLQGGALGALLNADSYAFFATQVAFEYLGGIYRNPCGCYQQPRVSEIMSTAPSKDMLPVSKWWLQRQPPQAAKPPLEAQPQAPSASQSQPPDGPLPEVPPQHQEPKMPKPEMPKPKMLKPRLLKPKMLKPKLLKPKMLKSKVLKPEMHKPYIRKPEFCRPSPRANMLQSALSCTIL
jgi:hypothetical protein